MEDNVESIGTENLTPLRKAVIDILDAEREGDLESAVITWKRATQEESSYFYIGKRQECYYLMGLVKCTMLMGTLTGEDNPFNEERTYSFEPEGESNDEDDA